MARPSAEFFDEGVAGTGAVVAGRRTYDVSGAWGGRGPVPGLPLVVLTHRVPGSVPAGDPPYTFVTDGIEAAVGRAREMAGGKRVHLMGASVVQQSIRAGLLDELIISLVPEDPGAGGVRLLDGLVARSAGLSLRGSSNASWVRTYRLGHQVMAVAAGAREGSRVAVLAPCRETALVPAEADQVLRA